MPVESSLLCFPQGAGGCSRIPVDSILSRAGREARAWVSRLTHHMSTASTTSAEVTSGAHGVSDEPGPHHITHRPIRPDGGSRVRVTHPTDGLRVARPAVGLALTSGLRSSGCDVDSRRKCKASDRSDRL